MSSIPTKVTTEAIINASLENVWEDYTNPESIKGWAFASDDWACPHATNDLKVGGRFLTRMEAKDKSFGFDLTGTYLEVEYGKKIKYVLDKAPQTDLARVCEVHFAKLGDETTKVTVTFDAENQNPIEMQRNGWQSILNNFKKLAETKR